LPAPAPMPSMANLDGLNRKITDLEQKLMKVSETLTDLLEKKSFKGRSTSSDSTKRQS